MLPYDFFAVWHAIPWKHYKPTAKVDLTLMLVGLKPAARISFEGDVPKNRKTKDGSSHIFHQHHMYTLQRDASLYIARSNICQLLFNADNSGEAHEQVFGTLLGYPLCCVKSIAVQGEQNIDNTDKIFLKTLDSNLLEHRFLNTSYYTQGYALVSHVPCQAGCKASLKMAQTFYAKLVSLRNTSETSSAFSSWVDMLFNTLGVIQ